MKLDKKSLRHLVLVLFSAILFVFFLWNLPVFWNAFRQLIGLLMPIFIGFCIAFVLQPLVTMAEQPLLRWGNRHIRSRKAAGHWPSFCRIAGIACSLIIISGALTLLVFTILPEVTATIRQFRGNMPIYIERAREWLDHLPAAFAFLDRISLEELEIDWAQLVSALSGFLKNGAGNMLNGVVGATVSIIGGVWNVVFGFIIAIYIMSQRENITRFFKRLMMAYMPDEKVKHVFHVTYVANDAFSSFVTGQLTEALIIGLLCYLGMLIFKLPYALTIAAVVGFTALIPVFGAWFGAIFGVLLILTVEPIKALWFVIFLVVLQQLEGDLIYPRVVGRSMGLPGILVMLAVWIGGSFAGITGMLFSVPLCSMFYTLIKEAIDTRLRKKEAAAMEAESPPEN